MVLHLSCDDQRHTWGDVMRRPIQTPASNSESRKRNQPEPHWEPAVVALIERERRAAAVEALRSAADDYDYRPGRGDTSRHALSLPVVRRSVAIWLRDRADRIGADS